MDAGISFDSPSPSPHHHHFLPFPPLTNLVMSHSLSFPFSLSLSLHKYIVYIHPRFFSLTHCLSLFLSFHPQCRCLYCHESQSSVIDPMFSSLITRNSNYIRLTAVTILVIGLKFHSLNIKFFHVFFTLLRNEHLPLRYNDSCICDKKYYTYFYLFGLCACLKVVHEITISFGFYYSFHVNHQLISCDLGHFYVCFIIC